MGRNARNNAPVESFRSHFLHVEPSLDAVSLRPDVMRSMKVVSFKSKDVIRCSFRRLNLLFNMLAFLDAGGGKRVGADMLLQGHLTHKK